MLCCLLYRAQVIWENQCCYNEPCSYGNHNLSLKIVVCSVQAAPELTLSPCLVPAFACVNSGSGDEAKANTTRDLCTGVLMTDG